MRLRFVAAVLSLVLAPLAHAQTTLFNQNEASPLGPNYWGTLKPPGAGGPWATCGSVLAGTELVEVGTKQSPIDILDPVPAPLPALTFTYAPAPFEVENNGHTIEVVWPAGSFLRIGQDGYELRQFHIHVPSEHKIASKFSKLELHLVHQNAFGDLAVVGVMFDTGLPANKLIEQVIAAAPLDEGVNVIEGATIDAMALLPAPGSRGYYAYSGALTTPPCTEGVRWSVLETPIGISQLALDHVYEIVARFPGYDGYQFNNRPVRPLHDRKIFRKQ
jgi:carbonic anhydrase